MNLKIALLLLVTHIGVGALGFGLGIYALPILIAPPSPELAEVKNAASSAVYTGTFEKELTDSDGFHWAQGEVSISPTSISFMGEIAPGPDYKLYLSKRFIDTEAEFNNEKSTMLKVGEVKTFDRFVANLASNTPIDDYNTIIIWCETFGEFISAARYR